MSEECTDYYDCRVEASKLFRPKSTIRVEVTKHAVTRLLERRPRDYKKLDPKVIEDVVRNVVRDGFYKAFSDKIIVWTKKYVLICTIDRGPKLIVKTVLTYRTLEEKVKKLIEKGGRRLEGLTVYVDIPHLETADGLSILSLE